MSLSLIESDKPLIVDNIPPLHSLHIFSERMRQALPGKRGLVEIGDTKAIRDFLDTVLRWPLCFATRDMKSVSNPIWWWRGTANLQIVRYEYVEEHAHFLIDSDELDIARLVAHRTLAAEDVEFVYVETRAVDPSGIYTLTDSDLSEEVAQYGFAREVLGYYKGRYISIEQYQDGYANINGEIVPLTEAESRRRYLTPYNLLIAPQASRINNDLIDWRIRDLLNGILTGISALEDIVELLRRTPRKWR